MPVYILGTGLSHNGSAVLLKDGHVFVAIEKERLTRIKHDGGNDKAAVQYCLDAAGISVHDLDLIVQCANFEKEEIALTRYHGQRLFPANLKVPVVSISHHLAHAYSAVGTSPFEENTHVLVLDGCGSPYAQCDDKALLNLASHEIANDPPYLYCEKDSFYDYSNGLLQALVKDFSFIKNGEKKHAMSPPTTFHSIGGMYSAASHYCFGNMDDAGKLMGLAPYGRKGLYHQPLFTYSNGRVLLNEEAISAFDQPAKDFASFKNNFAYYAGIARWVQEQAEEAILYLVSERMQYSRATRLCYSGGVALNALANTRILHETGLQELYIEPAAGDNGLALGCAYYGWLHLMKREKVKPAKSTCFGKTYEHNEITLALGSYADVQIEKVNDIASHTASLLAKGKVIGWFQQGSEFGPRALGHRSIIADPRKPGVRDFINREIKCREDFRPFAPSVLLEDVSTYFEYEDESPYMLLVNPMKDEWKEVLKSVVHENGTSRVQTVTAEWNGAYHTLLTAFKQATGLGMLLNTSFNKRGMPIVETPQHAIDFFIQSKLDHLIMDQYIISKKEEPVTDELVRFIRSIGIEVSYDAIEGETFLPGILIKDGGIIVDESKLLYPGDLLHEAGHLAVLKPDERKTSGGNMGEAKDKNNADGEELMAIAWSYAALSHLGIDPEIVFHPQGYKGASDWYIEQYTTGKYIALPLLQWIGLCYDEKNAQTNNAAPFPAMIKWLRD